MASYSDKTTPLSQERYTEHHTIKGTGVRTIDLQSCPKCQDEFNNIIKGRKMILHIPPQTCQKSTYISKADSCGSVYFVLSNYMIYLGTPYITLSHFIQNRLHRHMSSDGIDPYMIIRGLITYLDSVSKKKVVKSKNSEIIIQLAYSTLQKIKPDLDEKNQEFIENFRKNISDNLPQYSPASKKFFGWVLEIIQGVRPYNSISTQLYSNTKKIDFVKQNPDNTIVMTIKHLGCRHTSTCKKNCTGQCWNRSGISNSIVKFIRDKNVTGLANFLFESGIQFELVDKEYDPSRKSDIPFYKDLSRAVKEDTQPLHYQQLHKILYKSLRHLFGGKYGVHYISGELVTDMFIYGRMCMSFENGRKTRSLFGSNLIQMFDQFFFSTVIDNNSSWGDSIDMLSIMSPIYRFVSMIKRKDNSDYSLGFARLMMDPAFNTIVFNDQFHNQNETGFQPMCRDLALKVINDRIDTAIDSMELEIEVPVKKWEHPSNPSYVFIFNHSKGCNITINPIISTASITSLITNHCVRSIRNTDLFEKNKSAIMVGKPIESSSHEYVNISGDISENEIMLIEGISFFIYKFFENKTIDPEISYFKTLPHILNDCIEKDVLKDIVGIINHGCSCVHNYPHKLFDYAKLVGSLIQNLLEENILPSLKAIRKTILGNIQIISSEKHFQSTIEKIFDYLDEVFQNNFEKTKSENDAWIQTSSILKIITSWFDILSRNNLEIPFEKIRGILYKTFKNVEINYNHPFVVGLQIAQKHFINYIENRNLYDDNSIANVFDYESFFNDVFEELHQMNPKLEFSKIVETQTKIQPFDIYKIINNDIQTYINNSIDLKNMIEIPFNSKDIRTKLQGTSFPVNIPGKIVDQIWETISEIPEVKEFIFTCLCGKETIFNGRNFKAIPNCGKHMSCKDCRNIYKRYKYSPKSILDPSRHRCPECFTSITHENMSVNDAMSNIEVNPKAVFRSCVRCGQFHKVSDGNCQIDTEREASNLCIDLIEKYHSSLNEKDKTTIQESLIIQINVLNDLINTREAQEAQEAGEARGTNQIDFTKMSMSELIDYVENTSRNYSFPDMCFLCDSRASNAKYCPGKGCQIPWIDERALDTIICDTCGENWKHSCRCETKIQYTPKDGCHNVHCGICEIYWCWACSQTSGKEVFSSKNKAEVYSHLEKVHGGYFGIVDP